MACVKSVYVMQHFPVAADRHPRQVLGVFERNRALPHVSETILSLAVLSARPDSGGASACLRRIFLQVQILTCLPNVALTGKGFFGAKHICNSCSARSA